MTKNDRTKGLEESPYSTPIPPLEGDHHPVPDLAEALMEIGRRCSALPDLDTRDADEILGYAYGDEPAISPLGSRLAERFADVGLEQEIPELRGQPDRPMGLESALPTNDDERSSWSWRNGPAEGTLKSSTSSTQTSPWGRSTRPSPTPA